MEYIIKNSLNRTHSLNSSSKKKKVERDQIFPNEILFRIFSYCDIDTLFHSIPYVSHQWNGLLKKISFAGQINLKIYDDEQFKKLYSKSKSKSSSGYSNPYALPNTSSYGYTGYSSYGSYGGLSNYDNYSSYSNYNSYGNYDSYGSFGGYSSYNDYNGYNGYYGYGSSSSNYSLNPSRKDKEFVDETDDLLEPDYHIQLLETKQTNDEVSMPVVFKIDLALPLSFIKAQKEEEEINDSHDLYECYDEYFSNDMNDLSGATSSNSNKKEGKDTLINFDLEPIQGYLVEKQKEIKQFKAFYYIHGIEISIDTDKVITVPSNQNVNNNDSQPTTSSEEVSSSTIEMEASSFVGRPIQNNTESLSIPENISNSIDHEALSSVSTSTSTSLTSENIDSTEIQTAPVNAVHPEDSPPNSTMILTELLLEKYRFTPSVLKIENVQWSTNFIHMIPKSVKMIDIKYLGNPDAELLKEGTDYLYSFIKNLSISASSILRPRTRRTNRFYRSSVNRTSITVN